MTLLLVAASAAPSWAEGHGPPVNVDVDGVRSRNNSSVRHTVESDSVANAGGTESSARRGGASGRTTTKRLVFFATFPTVETQPDGSACIRNRRRGYPNPVAAAAATDAQNALWRLAAASFPLCQRTPVPQSTPAAQAAEFWRVVGEDLLPRPAPRIAPGYMLAGKLAYLEAGTVPTAVYEHPTPAGVLRIEARAEGWVDWGDGSPLDGPYDHAGGPWPDGTITHYWTDVGRYDVRVVQRWTGRWVLGTESGELAGLETEGVIDDFAVEELQAVINR
jgi:hypothetical protein